MPNETVNYEVLWQKYSHGVISIFPGGKSKCVAYRALQEGESKEVILRILECDPAYHQRLQRRGLEYANNLRYLSIEYALKRYRLYCHQPDLSSSLLAIVLAISLLMVIAKLSQASVPKSNPACVEQGLLAPRTELVRH